MPLEMSNMFSASRTSIDSLHFETPFDKIMARLRFRKHKTVIPREDSSALERKIISAVSFCEIRTVYRPMKIIGKSRNAIRLEKNFVLKSEKISDFLSKSEYALFMAATVGKEICGEIRNLSAAGKLADAVIFDAVASEVADEAMNHLNEIVRDAYRKNGYAITKRRFSPGYGDFSLDHQRIFFEILSLEKLGLELTNSFIIVPEKSVTAIGGLLSP